MVSVTHATESDLSAIAHMRLALGWQPNRWLLDVVQRIDSGQLFLVRDSRDGIHTQQSCEPAYDILAVASAVAYGPRGFIGNVIVRESVRRRGLGQRVMLEAIEWLRQRRVDVVELDATPEGRPLYERLGFVGTSPSWFMHTPVADQQRQALAQVSAVSRIETLHAGALGQIERLDTQAFGGSRLDLLREILVIGGSRLYANYDAFGEIVGYLMARPLDAEDVTLRVGPWVAKTPQSAAALLHHAVAAHEALGGLPRGEAAAVLACVDGTNQHAAWLARICGLSLEEDDLRMRLVLADDDAKTGSAHAASTPLGHPEWVYAMTAPMVG